jgi:RHS repeat-associated protein
MNLVDRVNRERSLTAISRTLQFGRIVANTSVPTTTYSYDANGNLIQAGGWNYVWDYLNRMLASGYNNSTTTYAYDPSGARVLQTSTTSTTYYPNKYYSFASTKSGANTYATSTNYVFNGDTLLATIDQPLYNGAATGSAIYRYIHPDHLGSTNVVTDASGTLVQLLDYYPYGTTRVASTTYPTNEKRQYIGQYYDAGSNLNYLMSRCYDSARGQFVNEDPVFWEIGVTADGKSVLSNPQAMNSYNYANDNPIVHKDPTGRIIGIDDALEIAGGIELVDLTMTYGPGILGGINGAITTYAEHANHPDTPAPTLGQYGTSIGAGALSGYYAERSLVLGGLYNAGGTIAQSLERGDAINGGEVAYSLVSPALSTKLFKYLAGDEPLAELEAALSKPSLVFSTNVSNITSQQLGYMISSGGFGLSMDLAMQKAFYAGVTNPSGKSSSSGQSGGGSSSSSGVYGSSGTVYTQFMPANTHSACGTLCK